METYRLSSKLREKNREYLIQTGNDISLDSVATTVYVDGVQTETFSFPHSEEISPDQLLSLVKAAHADRKEELEGLLESYRRAAESSDPDAMFQLATAFYNRRLYHESADLLQGAIHLAPDHHPAQNQLCLAFMALGETEAALASATEAVGLRPGFADYRNNLGEAYLAAGEAEKAIAELEAAIAINMYYGEAYFNLGLTYAYTANRSDDREQAHHLVSRARECFQKATHIYPAYRTQEDYFEGLKALDGGDFGRSISLLMAVREARKELRRKEFLALNQRLLAPPDGWTEGAIAEQIRSLTAQLKENPNYLDLQTELVRCYLERARLIWEQGIEECGRILEAHPEEALISETLESAGSAQQVMIKVIAPITAKG